MVISAQVYYLVYLFTCLPIYLSPCLLISLFPYLLEMNNSCRNRKLADWAVVCRLASGWAGARGGIGLENPLPEISGNPIAVPLSC